MGEDGGLTKAGGTANTVAAVGGARRRPGKTTRGVAGWALAAGLLAMLPPAPALAQKSTKPAKAAKPGVKTGAKATPKAALPPLPTPVSYPLPDGRKPFVDKLPGTLVDWEMLPIPAPPGGKAFYMSRTEVLWNLFDVFAYRLDLTEEQKAAGVDAEARPSKPYGAPDRGFGHVNYAALGMHYQAVVRFCEWLSRKTGRKYRMPTEAEWEWAAAAGETPKVLSPAELRRVAWFRDNAVDKAMEVRKLAPNRWGLYDMLGNVGEFCFAPEGTPAGKEPIRGGSWNDKSPDVQVKSRQYWQPDWQMSDAQIPKSKWWLSDGPYPGIRLVCEDAPTQ